MTITIKTDHVATVYEILVRLFRMCDIVKSDDYTIRITCDTDTHHHEIAQWLTNAQWDALKKGEKYGSVQNTETARGA